MIVEKIYKFGEKVPQSGRYECIICGVIIEYKSKHIAKGAVFGLCPVCYAGSDAGPKRANDHFWKFIGE